MSHGTCPYTTVAALTAADKILGPERVWNAVSDVQGAWLDRYLRLKSELDKIQEIATNATYDPADHIGFLKKHGWEAQIQECGPDEFLLASVLDLLGLWQVEGDRTSIRNDAFRASTIMAGAEVFLRRGTNERCARLMTQAGDAVWLEMTSGAPEGSKLSADAASRFLAGDLEPDKGFLGVTFPCIDFGAKMDLAWIKDLWTMTERNNRARILEAKQAFEIKANEVGFRARSSDEMRGVEESCWVPDAPPFVIDQPFMMAATRTGLSLPLVTAYLTEDAWKNPETL